MDETSERARRRAALDAADRELREDFERFVFQAWCRRELYSDSVADMLGFDTRDEARAWYARRSEEWGNWWDD